MRDRLLIPALVVAGLVLVAVAVTALGSDRGEVARGPSTTPVPATSTASRDSLPLAIPPTPTAHPLARVGPLLANYGHGLGMVGQVLDVAVRDPEEAFSFTLSVEYEEGLLLMETAAADLAALGASPSEFGLVLRLAQALDDETEELATDLVRSGAIRNRSEVTRTVEHLERLETLYGELLVEAEWVAP